MGLVLDNKGLQASFSTQFIMDSHPMSLSREPGSPKLIIIEMSLVLLAYFTMAQPTGNTNGFWEKWKNCGIWQHSLLLNATDLFSHIAHINPTKWHT